MAKYRLVLFIDGTRIDLVRKKLEAYFGEDAVVRLNKLVSGSSRSERLSDAESSFEDVKTEVAQLRDEIQEWQDNLPENLQGGTKNDELQEALDALEELCSDLENVSWQEVNFPGMF